MTITEYEQKIRTLNNTEFEELIHELIVKEYDRGNNNFHINHTGKKIGKQVPKKNSPDIWFSVSNDNQVVNSFVEITSQEADLFEEKGKIYSDLSNTILTRGHYETNKTVNATNNNGRI